MLTKMGAEMKMWLCSWCKVFKNIVCICYKSLSGKAALFLCVDFVCEAHPNWGAQLTTKNIINVHYNNGQKIVNSLRKNDLLSFKKGIGKRKLTVRNNLMHA